MSERAGQLAVLCGVVEAVRHAGANDLALIFDSGPAIHAGPAHAKVAPRAELLWRAMGAGLLNFAVRGWLLVRHPSAAQAPNARLVLSSAWGPPWWMAETLAACKRAARALITSAQALSCW